MRRVIATIALILLVGCVIATVICAIAGAPKNVIITLLLCDMGIPFMLYVYQWFAKVIMKYTKNDVEKEK